MVEEAIGLGLVISLMFSETLGLAAGGMVVPGYLALLIHEPLRIIGTVLVSLVTFGTLKILSRYGLIYRLLALRPAGVALDLSTIGYVLPGLIANWMERQGVLPTLFVMTSTAVLVRLMLMLLSGGSLIR